MRTIKGALLYLTFFVMFPQERVHKSAKTALGFQTTAGDNHVLTRARLDNIASHGAAGWPQKGLLRARATYSSNLASVPVTWYHWFGLGCIVRASVQTHCFRDTGFPFFQSPASTSTNSFAFRRVQGPSYSKPNTLLPYPQNRSSTQE